MYYSSLIHMHENLLFVFQTFVEKFKVAEQGALKKRNQSTMEPLLYETFNPHDLSKWVPCAERLCLYQLVCFFLNVDNTCIAKKSQVLPPTTKVYDAYYSYYLQI